MAIALTRAVSPTIVSCELTHLQREPIDVDRARAQHLAYERALEAIGCSVVRVPEAREMPDAVFIEDTAIVLDEIAIAARPGADSRRPEVSAVAAVLARHRDVVAIEEPGTLDGGDVMVAGRHVFVGRSSRTNDAGFEQLLAAVEPLGYRANRVEVHGCLHLKSAVTAIDARTLVINRDWVDADALSDFDLVDVASGEPFGANVLSVAGRVISAASCPRTRARLETCGVEVTPVDLAELAKAEGAVTCCSLIVWPRTDRRSPAVDRMPPADRKFTHL